MTNSSIAFVFPGQGSQAVGMMAAAFDHFAVVRQTFEEASEVLGYDMWSLIQAGPQESLNLTANTQPVLLASSVALWRAWQAAGGASPAVMAGHSLGEFSALVCAGSLQYSDALDLVRRRGEFMQTAVPVGQGAMAAVIGLEDATINTVCADISSGHDQLVVAVNFNSPGQVVIAGHSGAVELASAALKEAGAKRVLPLPVSAPFHTPLMHPAGEKLAEVLSVIDVQAPSIPVVHNVNAMTETDPQVVRALLVEQISSPVLWTACVQSMVAQGSHTLVECGPGKVLSGLAKRIDKTLASYAIEQPDVLHEAVSELS